MQQYVEVPVSTGGVVRVARKATDDDIRRACEMTIHGRESKVNIRSLYRAEHSPIRCDVYWVELLGVPTASSVHFVRHKLGVEHFVGSNRPDRPGGVFDPSDELLALAHMVIEFARSEECTDESLVKLRPLLDLVRNIPLTHGMHINAQALITMARKRLCHQADKTTVAWMEAIKEGVLQVKPDLAFYMQKMCDYRMGYCPENKPCGDFKVKRVP